PPTRVRLRLRSPPPIDRSSIPNPVGYVRRSPNPSFAACRTDETDRLAMSTCFSSQCETVYLASPPNDQPGYRHPDGWLEVGSRKSELGSAFSRQNCAPWCAIRSRKSSEPPPPRRQQSGDRRLFEAPPRTTSETRPRRAQARRAGLEV